MGRACAAAVLLLLAACVDAAGPRPRPGTPRDSTGGGVAAPLIWYALDPRVVTIGSTDSVLFTARFNGNPVVRLTARNGDTFTLRRSGTLYDARIPVSALLGGYRPGDLHHIGAQLDIDNQTELINIGLNIRDGSLPSVNVRGIAPGIQATDRIINVRLDTTSIGQTIPASLIRDVYRHFPDDYDFIAVIEAVRSVRNRSYQGVRNDIAGIGILAFDNGSQFGSASALQGIIQFPNDDFFDLAETSNLHEIGHRWIHFTDVPLLAAGAPHWPLSSLAYGIMGYTDTRNGQGLEFPYSIVDTPDGFRLDRVERATEFNDFELYLMGLLPADQVKPYVVFSDQTLVAQVRGGAVLPGPVDTVHVNDIITREGPRNPGAAEAPRTFRVATLVLSRGRLLTPGELAFFDHMAARGESETILPYALGLIRGQTRPFFLATGQRARLITRLAPN